MESKLWKFSCSNCHGVGDGFAYVTLITEEIGHSFPHAYLFLKISVGLREAFGNIVLW